MPVSLNIDGGTVVVDEADVAIVQAHPWRFNSDGYVCFNKAVDGKSTAFLLHRVIVGAGNSVYVDHWNRDRADNTRQNLRLCSQSQNLANRPGWAKPKSSRFKGVSWRKDKGKWEAHIKVNRTKIRLGYFVDEVAAADAYDLAALKHFGEFAYLNHAQKS